MSFLQIKHLTRIWWVHGGKLWHPWDCEKTHKCISHPHPDSLPAFGINKCQVRQPYGTQGLLTSVNHCETTRDLCVCVSIRQTAGLFEGWEVDERENLKEFTMRLCMHNWLFFWCNQTFSNGSNVGERRLGQWQPRRTDHKPNWLMIRQNWLYVTD